MPHRICLKGASYVRRCVFKHDFFAATGLYESDGPANGFPRKVVLKVGRQQNLFGIPMRWLGRAITEHEIDTLRRLSDMHGVPRLFSPFDSTGFAYEFIEGRSLDNSSDLPLGFFDDLRKILDLVHRHGMAYLDMNKRGNILVGDDGRPHIIDFQLALHVGDGVHPTPWIACRLLRLLQACDIYHLLKHKRKFCPHELTAEERALASNISRSIKLHRRLTRPFTAIRRAILKSLFASRFLARDDDVSYSPENDPGRFIER